MTDAFDTAGAAEEMTFESAMEELSSIVSKMEGGSVKLSELVAYYERAMALKIFLERALADARLKIEKAQTGLGVGEVVLEPFEAEG